jgi:DNA-binding transcriptional LysR family regulator
LELRHLRHFIGVAEELHFGRAAERLHIEQSPLSKSIKDLESDLGVKLFERTTRSTRLTVAGEIFLHQARQVLFAVEKARTSMSITQKHHKKNIRLAITGSLAQAKFSKLVAQCRKDSPDLELLIYEMTETRLTDALQTGHIDIGISSVPLDTKDAISEPLWQDSLTIAAPSKHPISTKKTITIDDIIKHNLITLNPITHHLLQLHYNLDPKQYQKHLSGLNQTSSLEMFLLLVSAGHGVGIGTQSQLSLLKDSDIFIRPILPEASATTSYLVKPKNNGTEIFEHFLAIARQTADTQK